MPVLALFSGPITQTQYETIRREIDWEHHQPAGALFHAASFDEAGHIHVADVWESAEALDTFAHDRLIPAFQKHGFTPPTVAVFPTHLVQAYSAIDRFRI